MPPRTNKIRAVVFDLDDTLFLERDYVRSGFAAVGKYLRQLAASRRPPVSSRGGLSSTPRAAGTCEDWMWREFLAGRRERMFDALNDRFRLRLSRADIASLVAVYRAHRPAIRPCRGVFRLLGRLRARGLRLGLLSDGYLPAQPRKLAALDLRKCFDAVVFTENLGRRAWKPSSRGFEVIRRRLGVLHAACVYVADNPAKDFLAANRLGWLTIQWRRPGQLHADLPAPPGGAPQRIVRSAPQLLRLFSPKA